MKDAANPQESDAEKTDEPQLETPTKKEKPKKPVPIAVPRRPDVHYTGF